MAGTHVAVSARQAVLIESGSDQPPHHTNSFLPIGATHATQQQHTWAYACDTAAPVSTQGTSAAACCRPDVLDTAWSCGLRNRCCCCSWGPGAAREPVLVLVLAALAAQLLLLLPAAGLPLLLLLGPPSEGNCSSDNANDSAWRRDCASADAAALLPLPLPVAAAAAAMRSLRSSDATSHRMVAASCTSPPQSCTSWSRRAGAWLG